MAALGSRSQLLDGLRSVAAFGIVWYHLRVPGYSLAYSGLVIFVALSVILTSDSRGGFADGVKERWVKLMLPWLCWSSLYAVINLLLLRSAFPQSKNALIAVLAGSSIHLWYLPFAFLLFTVIRSLMFLSGKSSIAVFSWLLTVLALATASIWRPWSFRLDPPWLQYMHAIPAASAGAFVRFSGGQSRLLNACLAFGILLIAFIQIDLPGIGLPYLFGLGALFFVQQSKVELVVPVNLRWLADRTFGIYLIHPLVIMVAHKFVPFDGLCLVLAVFAMSLFAVEMGRRLLPAKVQRLIW